VGAEIVRQLLKKGYGVKAIVRQAPDAPQLAHLVRVAQQSPGKLDFRQVRPPGGDPMLAGMRIDAMCRRRASPSAQVHNLLEPSKELDAALEGSTYVFHVASPFRWGVGGVGAAALQGGARG
jgi:uncharacterized protein YbjT (DUF2867 family)